MKKTRKTYILGTLLGLIVLPGIALASPIIRSGEAVSVASDQVLEGDFYAVGNTVSLSGTAEHDVYIAGGTVTVNGEVAEDLVVAGGTVQIHAVVGDDLRIVSGDVTIAEQVGGDVLVFGGTVKILSTAQVEGDVLFMGGDIDINGGVKGSVVGKAERIRLDAGVGGDLRVTAGRSLTLGDRAEVLGNVVYKSNSELTRAQGAVVVGDIIQESVAAPETSGGYAVLPLLMVLFAGLALYLLFKRHLQRVVNATKVSYGINGLIGLGVLILTPLVSVLLVVSVLGVIPGVSLFLFYILLLLAAWVLSGIVLGTFLMKYFMKTEQVNIPAVIGGSILFDLLLFVPYIGFLVALAIFVIVLGTVSRVLYEAVR